MSRHLNSRLDRIRKTTNSNIIVPSTIELNGYDEPADYYTIENGKERLMTDDEVYRYQTSGKVMSDISITIGDWED